MEQKINKIAQPYPIVSTTKKLYMGDVIDSQARLSLNRRFVTEEILPSLLKEGENFANGINVKVLDNRLQKFHMIFKDWGSLMVLTSGWNQLVHANKDLEEGVTIQIWVFRDVEEDRLCFAICRR
ncbi:putative B3 domain-containing protein At4g03170 [Papaver somniferum]|uniref:putative B3 domain-containing protein At4g03170 n=1 Tax=Papaver somniferum TaxID=3469 RepID=UPI000E6FECE3|nr:putative B3 domain-containing protein At4g03170 [Papaver somniferum]